MTQMKYLDLFAGIGGFRSGLSYFGDFFVPVGYCEINPYVRRAYEAMYDTVGEKCWEDVRSIVPAEIPDIDLICGGFPCQSFSVAGRRGGFEDARGTLFFEIARIAKEKRPTYLLLENVVGLLSHDNGQTFAAILNTLSELGYDVAWQVLQSANFGIPQSRRRILMLGTLREKCDGVLLAFTDANPQAMGQTEFSQGFLSGQSVCFIDMNSQPKLTALARCIIARQNSGISHHRGEHSGVLVKANGKTVPTPLPQDLQGFDDGDRIRRLLPIECWRLQGFTDEQFYKAKATGLTDARLFEMAGNAVSVPIITALGGVIKQLWESDNHETAEPLV